MEIIPNNHGLGCFWNLGKFMVDFQLPTSPQLGEFFRILVAINSTNQPSRALRHARSRGDTQILGDKSIDISLVEGSSFTTSLDHRHQAGSLGRPVEVAKCQQEFQVPKMEALNLIRLFLGVGFPLHKPYISRIHTAYMGEDASFLGTWNFWWKYVTHKTFRWWISVNFFLSPIVGGHLDNLSKGHVNSPFPKRSPAELLLALVCFFQCAWLLLVCSWYS